jgi:hypothetical protein
MLLLYVRIRVLLVCDDSSNNDNNNGDNNNNTIIALTGRISMTLWSRVAQNDLPP